MRRWKSLNNEYAELDKNFKQSAKINVVIVEGV